MLRRVWNINGLNTTCTKSLGFSVSLLQNISFSLTSYFTIIPQIFARAGNMKSGTLMERCCNLLEGTVSKKV
jgi:hypothetical protein